jgi:hypothetical protein
LRLLLADQDGEMPTFARRHDEHRHFEEMAATTRVRRQ